jgi:hypothetical protein
MHVYIHTSIYISTFMNISTDHTYVVYTYVHETSATAQAIKYCALLNIYLQINIYMCILIYIFYLSIHIV